MPAGTIALTNNSTAVTGSGTAFTTELKANDFLVSVVGGVTYTLGVDSVTSDTALVLKTAYNGPAASGLAWTPIPNGTLVGITAQVAADVAKAIRGLNLDKANWQQVFSGTGDITVNLPDGSSFTGPAWSGITTILNNKANSGANKDITSLTGLTSPLGLGLGGTGAVNGSSAWGNLLNARGPGQARADLLLGTSATLNATTSIYDTTYNSVLRVGDHGLGSTVCPAISSRYTNVPTGFVRSTGENDPYGCGIYMHYSPDVLFHIMAEGGGNLRFRRMEAGNTIFNYTTYHTGNTTKASNGVLSAASPVCRIVKSQEESSRTDMDEESFEWCGAGTANDEARGITISRLDVGIYKIVGADGFAKEGWYLMPPRDPAGSGDLGIAEGEETESGGLTVRLYKRRYVLSDEGEIELTKGAAIDVPANSWIDVRLNMPENSAWNKRLKDAQESGLSAVSDEQTVGTT
ncbi:hypothetical protein Q3V30_12730 [Erwinia pyri]|uniref:Phage tail protein C-terminal domain-containing protein n=1 Tax=Erwinia pyri TaxID=3062598 RepID=A0AA50DI32_9GAMM|nr:hypothetical protein [Erwinia sp. DE2]WLS77353.1 hypothetical protein Q3V30_12730 [Erwinia sp. DE2]